MTSVLPSLIRGYVIIIVRYGPEDAPGVCVCVCVCNTNRCSLSFLPGRWEPVFGSVVTVDVFASASTSQCVIFGAVRTDLIMKELVWWVLLKLDSDHSKLSSCYWECSYILHAFFLGGECEYGFNK